MTMSDEPGARTIVLVGCGQMGSAMLRGWLRGDAAGRFVVIEPAGAPSELAESAATEWHRAPEEVAADLAPDAVVFAVKPQILDALLPAYRRWVRPETLFLSIAAGKTIAGIARHLGGEAAIIRCMPNTPAAIGRAITVACPNAHVAPGQRRLCEQLLAAIGDSAWVEDEALMDAVTAVSGSGPAYVFLLIEALAAAGARAGLPPELSLRLARATVAGAGGIGAGLVRDAGAAARERHEPRRHDARRARCPDGRARPAGTARPRRRRRDRALARAGELRARWRSADRTARPIRACTRSAAQALAGRQRGRSTGQRRLALDRAHGWRRLSMAAIAAEAGLPILTLYRTFPSKPAILCAFSRRIDETVLAAPLDADPDERPRDRVFDLLMRRFDALRPHRDALDVLGRELPGDPVAALALGAALLRSIAWMLEAAGISTHGLRGVDRGKAYGGCLRRRAARVAARRHARSRPDNGGAGPPAARHRALAGCAEADGAEARRQHRRNPGLNPAVFAAPQKSS